MTYRTISISTEDERQEGKAAATILPGQMLVKTSAADTVTPHATAGGQWIGNLFAIENSLYGKGIADPYASGSQVLFKSGEPGDEILMVLATSQTIAIGASLASAGNGNVKVANGTTDIVIAMALEAVTTTSATAMIRCQIA